MDLAFQLDPVPANDKKQMYTLLTPTSICTGHFYILRHKLLDICIYTATYELAAMMVVALACCIPILYARLLKLTGLPLGPDFPLLPSSPCVPCGRSHAREVCDRLVQTFDCSYTCSFGASTTVCSGSSL